MKCAHLIASREISACSALDKPYVPSLFELGEYCKTIDHRKCPFYLKGIIWMADDELSYLEGHPRSFKQF